MAGATVPDKVVVPSTHGFAGDRLGLRRCEDQAQVGPPHHSEDQAQVGPPHHSEETGNLVPDPVLAQSPLARWLHTVTKTSAERRGCACDRRNHRARSPLHKVWQPRLPSLADAACPHPTTTACVATGSKDCTRHTTLSRGCQGPQHM